MIFKELTRQDFRTSSTASNQLVDILQDDVATPEKRKRYQNWYAASAVAEEDRPDDSGALETVGTLRQVVSGLFQTVHDIDHTQQTSNPLVDMTFGIRGDYEVSEGGAVTWDVDALNEVFEEFDAQGKAVWEQKSLQVNEKLANYKQMAAQLLGNRDANFKTKLLSDDDEDIIDYPLFLSFRRLFFRDGLKRGTFAMRLSRSLTRPLSSSAPVSPDAFSIQRIFPYWQMGYSPGSEISEGEIIITDTQAAGSNNFEFGGGVGVLRVVRYNNDDPNESGSPFEDDTEVGMIFYDSGIVVLDMAKLFDTEQKLAGIISTLVDNDLGEFYDNPGGFEPAGLNSSDVDLEAIVDTSTTSFLPVGKRLVGVTGVGGFGSTDEFTLEDLLIQGSIDDVLDHIADTRFISEPQSNLSAITFQNLTKIKSMLVFCRVAPGEFNYSNNPSYTNEAGEIIARDDDGVKPFSYITKVGLYSANNDLLAVASLSRPIENGPDRDLTLRLRLDF